MFHLHTCLFQKKTRQRLVRVGDLKRRGLREEVRNPDLVDVPVRQRDYYMLPRSNARFLERETNQSDPFARSEWILERVTVLCASDDDHQLVHLAEDVSDGFQMAQVELLERTDV